LRDSLVERGTPGAAWSPTLGLARLTSVLNSAGTFWVFCLMFLICADVVARGAFDRPINGVAELVGYSIVATVYLQLANTLHVGRFTRAAMVIDGLEARRPVAAAVYNGLFSLIGVAVFALIANGAWYKLAEAWPDLRFGNAESFSILVWPLRAIVLVGATLTAVEYLLLLGRNLRDFRAALHQRRTQQRREPLGWPQLWLLAAVSVLIAVTAVSEPSKFQVGALSFVGILILISIGVHIAVGLIALSFVGMWIMMGDPTIALNTIKIASNEFLRSYLFGVIPLFVLMGLLVNESGVGKDTFDVARWLTRPIKGGLGVATVGANAVFAAITGSSIASAAVFARVAAPRMLERGYSPRFAVGTVAGSSVLGMLIPPSLLLIIYAFVAEQSVGALFIAAIVPGLVLAAAMALAIVAVAHFWPGFVGAPQNDDLSDESIGSAVRKLLPIVLLVGAVLGGIYSGLVTPVEAGAVGAMGALIVTAVKRRLTWRRLWNVMVETGHVSVAILFLILAANIFGRMLALSGLPQTIGSLIIGMDIGFYEFMALYLLVLIVLGMFLDSVSIMLIVLPLVLSLAESFGASLVWFGVITVIAVEMGLLTPPLGLSVFVVKSALGDERVSLKDIFAGSFPFVVIMLLVTVLLIAVPSISSVLL